MTLIRNLHDAPTEPVTTAGACGSSMAVVIGQADGAPNFAIRRIRVEPGGVTPHHSHDYEHEIVVLTGRGAVRAGGEDRAIGPGDVVFIPPGEEHRLRAADDEPMEFLCVTPTRSASGQPVPGT